MKLATAAVAIMMVLGINVRDLFFPNPILFYLLLFLFFFGFSVRERIIYTNMLVG
jgi:hypothetical protein